MNTLKRPPTTLLAATRRTLLQQHQQQLPFLRPSSSPPPPAAAAAAAPYSSQRPRSVLDQHVIVTGSARGIGKAIALRLAADGYNVCINDVPANAAECDAVAREIRALGRRATTAVADVSKRGEVRDMIARSVKELGPLHTMVANAGIAQVKALLDVSEEDFARMLAVNLTGVFNSYVEAARQLIAQGSCSSATAGAAPGKILGAASIVSFKPSPLLGHYSASKWAVRGLTQACAMEWARHGITVNAFAPGIVGTAMWERIDEELARQEGGGREVRKGDMMRKYVKEWTALGRVSVPEDVAGLVSFLAGPDSDFITGQTQVVDGGIVFT